LLDAAENGKQVVALVELKARFDEEANIEWARALEEAGVHVAYGVVGLKTHTKVALVVRNEDGRVRRYAHIGTGNYNDRTARIYEDIGLMTADPDIGADLSDLFNVLTGYSRQSSYRRLVVAPTNFRSRMLELIGREAAADDGRIVAKMNSLVDAEIMDALYDASAAGTSIDLIVRGICCLRPGVTGLSENIQVKSIIGRFLEHSRIWCFANGKELPSRQAEVYITSADAMSRNLERRVEVMVPITNKTVHDQVLGQVMLANMLDTEQSWELFANGQYERMREDGPDGGDGFNCHQYFMSNPSLSGRGAALEAGAVPRLKLKEQDKA
jgi:polyphosphate kinase